MQKATIKARAVFFKISGVKGLLKELKIIQGRVIFKIRSINFFLVWSSIMPFFLQYMPTPK